MTRPIVASLARIADFHLKDFEIVDVRPANWKTGDYVIGEVVGPSTELYHIETLSGAMVFVQAGMRVLGALGERAATLEGVGSWRDVVDGRMHALTSAGLFGAFTSISKFLPGPLALDYCGHVARNGSTLCMRDFALAEVPGGSFAIPTVLLVGTSMSAGKTLAGDAVCRNLSGAGFRIIAAKLTGAGRYRDIASFRKAGAAEVFDFVDAGLPSTVVPEDEFRQAIRPLLHHIGSRDADFLVAEAGASPLEPYNGRAAIDELGSNVVCTILCASDPYAVVGVQHAFGLKPDVVTGPATNTSAAIALVDKLAGVEAMNLIDPEFEAPFRRFLADRLGVKLEED